MSKLTADMDMPVQCSECEEFIELRDSNRCEWCKNMFCDGCIREGVSGENICVKCREHR
jgi:hypothetical protein